MKFRAGFIVGLAVGFVLGARAGKERYDALVARVRQILGSEPWASIKARISLWENIVGFSLRRQRAVMQSFYWNQT